MPELRSYLKHDMPLHLAWQVRSYMRIQWPFLDSISAPIWDFTPRSKNSLHFVIVHDKLLISHAAVNQRDLEVGKQMLRVYGLSAVFTYPAFRKGGYGRQVVEAATNHILASDADIAMLFCGRPVSALYAKIGWELVESARIYFGDPEQPTLKGDNVVMMLFISQLGKAARRVFEKEPVYVGPSTW